MKCTCEMTLNKASCVFKYRSIIKYKYMHFCDFQFKKIQIPKSVFKYIFRPNPADM